MDESAYRAKMAAEGYGEVEVLTREPNHQNELHTHDFAAAVLVLEGEITVTVADGAITTCRAGDTFALGANIEHSERIGPDGLRLLIARK